MNSETGRQHFEGKERPTIESTVRLIKELHAEQFDDQGQPYFLHPIRVSQNVLRLIFPANDPDMVMAALLHDTIEDCGVDADFLRARGYSEDCIEMVELLTKPPGDERPYMQVIDDLIASGNKKAMLIKIADNMDNLHPERSLRAERYQASIRKLANAVGLDENSIFEKIAHAPTLDELNSPHM